MSVTLLANAMVFAHRGADESLDVLENKRIRRRRFFKFKCLANVIINPAKRTKFIGIILLAFLSVPQFENIVSYRETVEETLEDTINETRIA